MIHFFFRVGEVNKIQEEERKRRTKPKWLFNFRTRPLTLCQLTLSWLPPFIFVCGGAQEAPAPKVLLGDPWPPRRQLSCQETLYAAEAGSKTECQQKQRHHCRHPRFRTGNP